MSRSLDFSTASPLIQRRAAQHNTAPNDAARPGTGKTIGLRPACHQPESTSIIALVTERSRADQEWVRRELTAGVIERIGTTSTLS